MTLKLVGLGISAVIAVVAVALIYPGIPCGIDIHSNDRKVVLTCSYLHWDGIRRKTITMANPSGVYTFTRNDCPS